MGATASQSVGGGCSHHVAPLLMPGWLPRVPAQGLPGQTRFLFTGNWCRCAATALATSFWELQKGCGTQGFWAFHPWTVPTQYQPGWSQGLGGSAGTQQPRLSGAAPVSDQLLAKGSRPDESEGDVSPIDS